MGKAKSALKSQEEALARARAVVEKAASICAERGWRLAGAYLVGSRARGDYTADSDVDLVLVVEGVKGLNALERLEAFKEALAPGVEIRVYTPEEWMGDGVWMRSLRKEAKPLWDSFK
ncbi:MAG: nucleotidyltransferase domain-containing protein [Pyrobaculum sp.]|uniref:nucleotidyltransferase domain-containing protein n=1 Tax=Pyrobaculum sp. TaxID=2004705 RepID=UPI003C8A31E6